MEVGTFGAFVGNEMTMLCCWGLPEGAVAGAPVHERSRQQLSCKQ